MASEPTHGRKIAITGHGFDVTENDIRKIFERFGPISEVVYIRNKDTGKSKGFSFVVYKDHSSAQQAINAMHHEFIFERRVSVMFARQHKLDDSSISYSPGLAKPPPHFHHHGSDPYRPLRRGQGNDFFHPRHPHDHRYPYPPGYPPSRSDMNHSPPSRFHAPVLRPDSIPKEKSSEVVQEQEPPQPPLATPSSLSGASEQEDGEIPSTSERKSYEPLEDGEMPDTGTPTQKGSEPMDESGFRLRQHDQAPNQFALSDWKIDAATEKLLENIIRIQGSVKIDSSEAQRVWAQGGLRKQVETSPPSAETCTKPQSQPLEESPLHKEDGEQPKTEWDSTPQPQTPGARPPGWRQGWSHDSVPPKDDRWDPKGGISPEFCQERNSIGKSMPLEGQRMLGHALHDGREWSTSGHMHRPDLRHPLGPDMHIADQNPGGYGYNVHGFPRPHQDPPSRPPPFSHGPHSRHAHFPPRHPHLEHQYQSFPQQQQPMPHPSQPSHHSFMGAPGPHQGQEMLQTPPQLIDQPQGSFDAIPQHPHQPSNYAYNPMPMQDPNNGYSMPYPRGANSMDHDSNIGLQQTPTMQDPGPIHQGMGVQHQQPLDVRNQMMGHSDGYQISPATIAQATIAQAAVNSDQSQDLSRSKDPMTLMSRMYVGNLDPKQVTKEDLHDTFSIYGRILDIKIHNHFAFIQFDNPFSCMDAIHTAQSNTIQGQQPKLQLAADGQRARNDIIFNGNTSSLPPDPKELPPNVPYPNPFRGQSGHLPTFLTVQPAHPPPVETPVTPQPAFQPSAPNPIPVPGIQQSAGAQPQPLPPQGQNLITQNLAPQIPQPQPVTAQPVQQSTQEATNAQINAQLLSTALGMDPSALATLLSSLPMLAKAKEEGKIEAETSHPGLSAAKKKKPFEKESKKKKKREVEKHAKARKLNELESKKQKAKRKEEELAKVRARLSGEKTNLKDIHPKSKERSVEKEKSKHKHDSKHEFKRSKHLPPDEIYKKKSKQDSSKSKDHTKPRVDLKLAPVSSSTAEKDRANKIETTDAIPENEEKRIADQQESRKTKLPHKSHHDSKSHKRSHHSKSQKRPREAESPLSAPSSPSQREDIMDQYAYMYDMISQNPMNRLMKDYHDYYVGIYGYDFSHWNSEYERFLEDFPMDEDTKEMLELMRSYNSYPYFYGKMGATSPHRTDSKQPGDLPQSSRATEDHFSNKSGPDELMDKNLTHTPT